MLTNILLILYIAATALLLYNSENQKIRTIIMACKILLNAVVLILGSFSDELAIVAILIISNIYFIAKKKNIDVCIYEWLIYTVECEIVGILTIIGIVNMVSATYEYFLQSVILDIVFVVMVVIAGIISERKNGRVLYIANSIFIGALLFFAVGYIVYFHVGVTKYDNSDYNVLEDADGEWLIYSAMSDNMVITADSVNFNVGDNIVLSMNENSFKQLFRITKLDDNSFTFQLGDTVMVMDVDNGGTVNGTNVQIWNSNNTASQKWNIHQTDDGYYTISSECNDLNLDVVIGDNIQGSNVIMYEKYDALSQKFRITKAVSNKALLAYMRDTGGLRGWRTYKSLIICVVLCQGFALIKNKKVGQV